MDPNLTFNLLASAVVLEPMSQQLEIHHPTDDWTGVTSTLERRRRQNRLNQRARRKKNRVFPVPLPMLEDNLARAEAESAGDDRSLVRQMQEIEGKGPRFDTTLPEGHLLLQTSEKRAKFRRFVEEAYHDYYHGTPRLEHFQILVKINVLGAIARNAALLQFGFKGLCRPDLISPLNLQGPGIPATSLPSQACPQELRPVALQSSVTHHPWIDLIPSPRFRENVLRAIKNGRLDSRELGLDLLNVDNILSDAPSLIVWGESWDLRGWEASLPFWRKWGWLAEGCPVMLEATNFWRRKRGEPKIKF